MPLIVHTLVAILLLLVALALTCAEIARRLRARRHRARATSVTDVSHAEITEGRPTIAPGEITLSMRAPRAPDESSAAARPKLPPGTHGLMALALVALAGCGAASTAASVASAVEDTMTVLKTARSLICTTKLDPLLGDPREGQPTYAPQSRDAGVLAVDASEDH